MMLEVLFKWSHGIKNHVLHTGSNKDCQNGSHAGVRLGSHCAVSLSRGFPPPRTWVAAFSPPAGAV